MSRHWMLFVGSWLCGIVPLSSPLLAQAVSTTATSPTVSRPEVVVAQALATNPATAPYNIVVENRRGTLILKGRVGTKQIHDVAIRTVIGLGYPVGDQLVIDTAAVYQATAQPAPGAVLTAGAAGYVPPGMAGAAGYVPPMTTGMASYVYPPPLFGRYDDPFYGFEPPLLSYPPWWGAMSQYRLGVAGMAPLGMAPGGVASPAAYAGPPATATSLNPAVPQAGTVVPSQLPSTVEMTIDPRGVAVLRGVVPTLAERVAVGQLVAQTPGVTGVINLLATASGVGTVSPGLAPAAGQAAPPPPQPLATAPTAPALNTSSRDSGLQQRLRAALERIPALRGQSIEVSVRDGVVTLSGDVPTVYEAMLAYRAAETTPGIRSVDDRLLAEAPSEDRPNPLIARHPSHEDVEPYLLAQIQRQVGELAHVDRVEVVGGTLKVRGTIDRPADRPRLEAILRSMPLLRGFKLDLELTGAPS